MTLSPLAPVHCRSCATTDGGERSASEFETWRASHLASRPRDALGEHSPAPPSAWAWPSWEPSAQAKRVAPPESVL
eukprot:773421-Prymnesium_polylepis.1